MKRKSIDSKKVVAILLIVVFSLVAILKLTTVFVSIVNYKINNKKWNDGIGIIYDQHLDNIKDYRYGFGTIGENGCGAVAIYNIMCLENKKVALPKIIKSMDNGQIFLGSWEQSQLAFCPISKNRGLMHNSMKTSQSLKRFHKIANIAFTFMLESLAGTTHFLSTTPTQEHSVQSTHAA